MDQDEIIRKIDGLIEDSNFRFDVYDFSKAVELIQEAISLAKLNNLEGKLVDGLGELGYYHVKEIGNIELARECYFACIDLLMANNGDRKLIASYYYRLGNTYCRSDPNKLIELYQSSLKYHSFSDDYITQSRIYEGMGLANLAIDNIAIARDNYLKALKIQMGSTPNRKTELVYESILKQLGNVYSRLGQEDKSNEFRQRSEKALDDFKKGLHRGDNQSSA